MLAPMKAGYSIVLVALLITISGFSSGQVDAAITKELVWSLPDSEITAPQFSEDGNYVVLVSRTHWPDGDEAESLPEAFFKKLEARKRKEPRFADPIVRLIDLKGNTVCEIRYGTNPTIAPDNKRIVFSRQKKPITGLRPLAETLAGNDIQIFDCEKKQARTIAEPATGYLDTPIFLPDRHSIAFTVNEAVNGAMGGPVGIDRVDANGAERNSLFIKDVTSSVPCPTGSEKLTGFQRMMCSKGTKLSSSFQTLLLNVEMVGGQLFVLKAKPLPTAGDMYLASHYELSLATIFPKGAEVFSLAQGDMNQLWDTSFQPFGDEGVMIFAGYWRALSLETRSWLPETAPRNTNRKSSYSPNGKYYLAMEPVGEEPSKFTLYRAADGERVFSSSTLAEIYDMAWSKDSRKFIIVARPKSASGSAYRENLLVYSIK